MGEEIKLDPFVVSSKKSKQTLQVSALNTEINHIKHPAKKLLKQAQNQRPQLGN